MLNHTSVVKAMERGIKSQVSMGDRVVSHKLSRLSDILFPLKSLPYTHHGACSSSPCRLSCPPGLAACCSRRQLSQGQAWGSPLQRWLRVPPLSGQWEGAQRYQQDPSVPAPMLSNECLNGEWSQEMNSPVESLAWDMTTPSTHPVVHICFLYFFQPGTPAFLGRGNRPVMLSRSARYATAQ